MRSLLKKAIKINPAFTESYELFAFVNMVNNEQLDESIKYLQKALQYQPGSQKYTLRIAEIFLRQRKFKETGKIAATSDDAEVKSRAENLTGQISQVQEVFVRQEESRKKKEDAKGKDKSNGEVVALEFVPKNFVLE